MRKTKIISVSVIFALLLSTCGGVDREDDPRDIGNAKQLDGDWQLVLLPLSGDCTTEGKGLAINSPLLIEGVKQNGGNLSGIFDLGDDTYILSGDIVLGGMVVLIESVGKFIATFGAKAETPTFTGSFNGQELPSGCSETGVFIGSIGEMEFPDVSGQWTFTILGVAGSCDDPADEGEFEKIITPITAISPVQGSINAAYMDPVGVMNQIAGIAVQKIFMGGITDTAIPPTRAAMLNGTIKTADSEIKGSINGELAFDGGVCTVSGKFIIDY